MCLSLSGSAEQLDMLLKGENPRKNWNHSNDSIINLQ